MRNQILRYTIYKWLIISGLALFVLMPSELTNTNPSNYLFPIPYTNLYPHTFVHLRAKNLPF